MPITVFPQLTFTIPNSPPSSVQLQEPKKKKKKEKENEEDQSSPQVGEPSEVRGAESGAYNGLDMSEIK